MLTLGLGSRLANSELGVEDLPKPSTSVHNARARPYLARIRITYCPCFLISSLCDSQISQHWRHGTGRIGVVTT